MLQLGDQSRVLEDVKNGLGTTQSQLKDTQKQVQDMDVQSSYITSFNSNLRSFQYSQTLFGHFSPPFLDCCIETALQILK